MLLAKYRFRMLLGLSPVLIALGIVYFAKQTESREPTYMNIRLTLWLKEYAEGSTEAEVAIRQIGTNGFPFLLSMIHSKDSIPKAQLLNFLSKQSVFDSNPALSQQLLAAKGFEALGAAANEAIPELEGALKEPSTSRGAALALVGIGSIEALASLLQALENDNRDIRVNSTLAFAQFNDPPDSAVIALCNVLNDKDHGVRFAAAEVLGGLASQTSNLAVPALVRALHDASPAVRYAAVRGLGRIGSNASSAIPEVRIATNDTVKLVREEAVRALARLIMQHPLEAPVTKD